MYSSMYFEKFIQAYLILLHFTLLCFTDVVLFTNDRQDPPLEKDYNLLYCDPHFIALV